MSELDALLDRLAEILAPRIAELLPDRGHATPPAELWRLLDLEEAAACLGRSTRWVRDRKAEIGYVRLDGGGLAFEVDDLRRFARERRIGGEPLAGAEEALLAGDFSRPPRTGSQKAARALGS